MWFDVENRLTQVGTVLYAGYNGDGLRAWKTTGGTTKYYLYDGTDLLCELSASGTVTATNTWGANGLVSRRVGATSTFYVFDPQGSVAQRLDASGNVVSSDLYDAYGTRVSGSSTDPVGYNGQWGYYTDSETGLALCTYRYYDPANGRWVTRDPIGYSGGVDLYGYVGGEPVDVADSLGLVKVWTAGKVLPSENTVTCDGCGHIVAQVGSSEGDCTKGCVRQHEESHVRDILRVNPDICKGKPAGTRIHITPIYGTEHHAYNIEINCLLKLQFALGPKCRDVIGNRLVRLYQRRKELGYE